ncbi:MAG: ABC transporter permease [Ignavibacteria bacterium]
MLKNYFLIALRNLLKYKAFSLINILGLTIGITCTILIFLYVQDEISYDEYHSKAGRIFRITEDIEPSERSASMPFPVAEALKTDFPDMVESYVRLFDFQTPTFVVEYENSSGQRTQVNEPNIFYADTTLFEVFDFKLLRGNPVDAFANPNSALLSESTAKRYFGNENPVGKIIRLDGQFDINVTGVVEDTPKNTHFKYDILLTMTTLRTVAPGLLQFANWYWNPCWTYIVLSKNTNPEDLKAQFPEFINKYFRQAIKDLVKMDLQPLTDIHLYSHRDFEITANSDVTLVYIFSIIAVFVLIIAAINFINLSTARSIKRAREVGVRKVMGAVKSQLIYQFLAESVLISIIAIIVSIPLVYLTLPALNALAVKQIEFSLLSNFPLWVSLFAIIIVIGFFAGLYPALFLSAFQPVKVLSGKIDKLGAGAFLRKTLVVSQFAVSIFLIVGTIITYNQLKHLRNANLGFDKEQVILIPSARSSLLPRYQQFKDQIELHENIKSVSASNMIIGAETQSATYTYEGRETQQQISAYFIRHDFIKTTGIELLAGRGFTKDFAVVDDSNANVVVNESFVKKAGWGDPQSAIGKRLQGTLEGELRIIGVVNDFHFNPLRQPIGPFIMNLGPNIQSRNFFTNFIYVRLATENFSSTIDFLETKFKEFVPERPFEYFFLDDRLNRLYQAEDSLGKVATVFSFFAIVVACLGLFGLASFTAEQKTKEIGIRKVIGATVSNIVMLLSKQFIILILIANVIAWPVAYFVMDLWLQDFTTQIEIDLIPFILAALFTFVIAFLTMSYQAIKAALTDPVKSIKYE